MLPITGQVQRASRLYDQQKVYGERLQSFKTERPVLQAQVDGVSISRAAMQSHETHRTVMAESKPISYRNPRVDNRGK